MVIFGVLLSPGYYRLTRTAVQSVRNELYVDAARVSGLSDGRIISRHILSVVRAPIIIQTRSLSHGLSIIQASSLEFLGLGDPTVPTWGVMVSDGFTEHLPPADARCSGPPWRSPSTIGGVRPARQRPARRARGPGEDQGEARPGPPVRRRAAPAALDGRHGSEPTCSRSPTSGSPTRSRTAAARSWSMASSFHVDRGEVVGIVGESGSGKSQTAFSILGLLPDNAIIADGAIQFDGAYTVASGEDPSGVEAAPAARQADRLHPAGADVQPRPRRSRSAPS